MTTEHPNQSALESLFLGVEPVTCHGVSTVSNLVTIAGCLGQTYRHCDCASLGWPFIRFTERKKLRLNEVISMGL